MSEAMTAWVREEQELLWIDLDNAIRDALNGTWSIQAANVAARIVGAARLVGPTPYDEVPWVLLAGGVYRAVLAAGDIAPEMPDESEWSRLDCLMSGHGRSLTRLQSQLAATVASVSAVGEQYYIAHGHSA